MSAGSPLEDGPQATPTARARRLARDVHQRQEDRYGRPMIEHVERVAGVVPPSARAVAWVHDVAERSAHEPDDVARLVGLDDDERDALALLTKADGESVVDHTHRVVAAPRGIGRELALVVKRADIDDHARRTDTPEPEYREARAALDAA